MSDGNICDYSGYDYKKEFWVKSNRSYEHQLELKMVKQLLNQYCTQFDSILDAGCGYGRMSPAYQSLFKKCYMVDYANNLLKEAKETLIDNDKFTFYQQSLYDLKLNTCVNAIISIRTLHHLTNVDTLFKKYHSALDKSGILILDVPNYYHIKNRLKAPFENRQNMVKLSDTFFNYDPYYIVDKLKNSGFNIIGYRQVGLFRIDKLKRLIPANILVNIEFILNIFLKNTHISPSVYIIAKKCG